MFNSRSLVKKLNMLHLYIFCSNPDLIFITETWFHQKLYDALVSHSFNYSIVRRDRDSRGGGVIILIKNNIHFLPLKPSNHFEIAGIDLFINDLVYRILLIYRPSMNSANTVKLFDEITNCFNQPTPFQPNHYICLGDFNLPNIFGKDGILRSSNTNIRKRIIAFSDALKLQQLITFPTHKNGNCLDLVFATSGSISNIIPNDEYTIAGLDHVMIKFQINSSIKLPEINRNYLNFKKADYKLLSFFLADFNWSIDFQACHSSQQMLNLLKTRIYQGIYEFNIIPISQYRDHSNKNIPNHIQSQMQCFLNSLTNDTATPKSRIIGINARKQFNRFMENVQKKLLSKPLNMFTYVSNIIKVKHPPIPTLKSGTQIFINDNEKANEFSNYFKSVFNEKHTFDPIAHVDAHINPLEDIKFTKDSIQNELIKSKNKNVNGPDTIPGIILKKCSGVISYILLILFNNIIMNNDVPDDFLISHVTPIPKVPCPSTFEDFRPISGCSDVLKCFERVLKTKIINHLNQSNFLPKQQFGFRNGYSTTKQLIIYSEYLYSKVSAKETIDVIYFDMLKAFDKIPIHELIIALKEAGIEGKLLNVITTLLSNRKFLVKVNSANSKIDEATSGVPQGSVLGPIYFIIFISKLSKILDFYHPNIIHFLFADDLKIIYSYLLENFDPTIIQNAINAIVEWCNSKSMQISAPKTYHLQFGKPNPAANYFIDGAPIIQKNVVRDLGFYISNDLSLSHHIDHITGNAYKSLFSILRKVIIKDASIMIRIFNAYVRPHLEYCCQLFNIPVLKDIDNLESPQRLFTRILYIRNYGFSFNIPNYEERLKLFNMESLRSRRNISDIVAVHDFLIQNPTDELSLYFNSHQKTRTKGLFLYRDPIIKTYRSRHFSSRMASILNKLKIDPNSLPPRNSPREMVRQHINNLLNPKQNIYLT